MAMLNYQMVDQWDCITGRSHISRNTPKSWVTSTFESVDHIRSMGTPGTFPMFVRRRTIPLARVKPLAGRGSVALPDYLPSAQCRGKASLWEACQEGAGNPAADGCFGLFEGKQKGHDMSFENFWKVYIQKKQILKKVWLEIPDIKIDNVEEMLGNQWSASLACSADWLSKEFCELSTDLGRSKAKAWKNSSIHLYAPPVTTVSMEGPSFRRWGTKKSVCSSPWTPKEAHAQGRSGLTTEFWRHIWQSDFKSHVHQCFECPMFWSIIMPIYPYIYIYMIIPRPSKQLCIGSFIPSSKSVPKVLWKKSWRV